MGFPYLENRIRNANWTSKYVRPKKIFHRIRILLSDSNVSSEVSRDKEMKEYELEFILDRIPMLVDLTKNKSIQSIVEENNKGIW